MCKIIKNYVFYVVVNMIWYFLNFVEISLMFNVYGIVFCFESITVVFIEYG